MLSYYQARAPIYDEVYSYPERQKDLRFLEQVVSEKLNQCDLLEIAAGTGYWTQFIAPYAKSILAIDSTESALEQILRLPNTDNVKTRVHDAYALPSLKGDFDGIFAGLWLSHVPKQRLRQFMCDVVSRVKPGSPIVIIDNSIAQCDRLPISYQDEHGNTYQNRRLKGGTSYEVLKNFPTQQELQKSISSIATMTDYIQLENFWLCELRTPQG